MNNLQNEFEKVNALIRADERRLCLAEANEAAKELLAEARADERRVVLRKQWDKLFTILISNPKEKHPELLGAYMKELAELAGIGESFTGKVVTG
jgi:hypothetical protein